jgi:D-alanyl-D-alanine-carboxypeptidase/D-alanyl-D-alanine-endopeptidase
MLGRPLFAPVLATFLLAATSYAARPSTAEVEKLAKPLTELQWCEGIVVGLIDDEGPRVFGFGKVSSASAHEPDGDTLFEIGSVTKAFTGILLADMVERGEVKLDDPVSKYLPETVKLPQLVDKPITLAHLATHTSGLPRMPTNFKPADLENPYADYTVEQMYAFLSAYKPTEKPGVKFEYSNLGMGLLGHVLSLHAAKDYETLLAERVLKPLGMDDTRITLDEKSRAKLAAGHDGDGEPVANWDLPTLAGAGSLRSSANDMLKLLAAAIDPRAPAELEKMLALSRKPRVPASTANEIGLGWHIGRNGSLVWHNGQTGGYHSYCAFVPERKVGVVVLANTGTNLVDELGVRLIDRLLDMPAEGLTLRKETKLKPEVMDQRVGRFLMTPVFALTISREGDRLYCQATDQPKFRIYAESETDFFYKAVEAQLTFTVNDKGQANILTLRQNGLKLPGLRADGPTSLPTTLRSSR